MIMLQVKDITTFNRSSRVVNLNQIHIYPRLTVNPLMCLFFTDNKVNLIEVGALLLSQN